MQPLLMLVATLVLFLLKKNIKGLLRLHALMNWGGGPGEGGDRANTQTHTAPGPVS